MKRDFLAVETVFLLAFSLVAAVCFVQPVFAGQDDIEDWIIQSRLDRYYRLPDTARVLGMGGSSRVTSTDIASVFGNPAGLGFISRPELGLNYSHDWDSGEEYAPGFFDTTEPDKALGSAVPQKVKSHKNQGGLQLVLPCFSCGVFGFGGWVEDKDYNDFRDSEANRYLLNAGYGYKVNDCFSFGYSLTYFNDEVDDFYADYDLEDGFRHTFGLMLKPCPNAVFGVSTFFAHGNPDVKVPGLGTRSGDLDSYGVEFGYSWQVLERTLLAASVDYTINEYDGSIYDPFQDEFQSSDEQIKGWGFHVGLEQNYFDCLLARVGYRYQTNDYENHLRGEFFRDDQDYDANYHAISTGLGWVYNPSLTIDYGVEYRFIGDGDVNNTVTARFHF
jgi:opacity protein-like surface antigen